MDERIPRIFILDDTPAEVIILKRLLKHEDKYELQSSTRSTEAEALILEFQPDLLLMDVMMPGLDGYELCERLRQHPKLQTLKIILVTALSGVSDKVAGLDAGADDYITKPFDRGELLARVRTQLRVQELQLELTEKEREVCGLYATLMHREKMNSIGFLAAGISHEFNNMMTTLFGYAQLAKKNDDYKDILVDTVLVEIEKAVRITGSLMTLSGKGVDVRKVSDVISLVEDTLVLVERELSTRGIEIQRFMDDVPETLLNRSQMQQALLNLIINAMESMERGGVLTLRVTPDQGKIRITIEDTGEGIEPDLVTHIFEPFYTTKGALGGGAEKASSGMGMAVTKSIIDKHNAEISVQSTPGLGTSIHILLPVMTERRKEDSHVEQDRRSESRIIKRLSILIIDGQKAVHSLVKDVLPIHNVSSVFDTDQAIEVLGHSKLDVIFLDVNTPGQVKVDSLLPVISSLTPLPRLVVMSPVGENQDLQSNEIAITTLIKPLDVSKIHGIFPDQE